MDIPPETSMRWVLIQRLSWESRDAIMGPMIPVCSGYLPGVMLPR